MTLVRWDPFREIAKIHDRLSRVLADTRFTGEEGYGAWVPPVDIFERGDDLVIRAELPGLRREDIEVRVENGSLVLRGERRRDEDIDEANAYRLERIYGTFTRSFALPRTVDTAKIQATYRDGVLEVVIPKSEEAKPKKVEIRVV